MKRRKITLEVTKQILMPNQTGNSYSYSQLTKMFLSAKQRILGKRTGKRKPPPISATMRNLQNRYSLALEAMENENSNFSYFVADNIEKLLNYQYKHEKDSKFSTWIRKMNDLDFQNRTRVFFSEIRSRQKLDEQPVPIRNLDGKLSDSLEETLKNWTEYYKNLYSIKGNTGRFRLFPIPNENEYLDKELSLVEFVDVIYTLKHYKSPGYDHIINEDMTDAILEDINEDPPTPDKRIELLKFIFKILSDFWFNECVPRDLKRTVLRPFLKDNEKPNSEPSNYRPISLLNTLMKIYEGIICRRIVTFLDKNRILSPYQAAYRKERSTADHIFIIHELFLEYRFNMDGPRGGKIRKTLFFCFLDLRKAFDTVPRHILFAKLHKVGIQGKMLRVIQNLFSSNPANVQIGDFLSPEFFVNCGILQRSKLCPILFNIFTIDLLIELENSGHGATIGQIHIPVLGFA